MRLTTAQRRQLMGQTVRVCKVLRRTRKPGDYRSGPVRTWRSVEVDGEPRAGWVVGFTVARDSQVTYEDGYAVPETMGGLPCMLVRYWFNREPVRVPLEDGAWEPGGEPDCREYSWPDGEYERQVALGYIRRDAGGRFTAAYPHLDPVTEQGGWVRWLEISLR